MGATVHEVEEQDTTEQLHSLSNKKPQAQDGSPGELYPTFKEEMTSIPCSLFQRIKAETIFPNSFYEASIILIPKPDKDITRKLVTSISNEQM